MRDATRERYAVAQLQLPSRTHVQFGPQVHASPHWQDGCASAAAVWQPHVQVVPAQLAQVQTVETFVALDIVDSSRDD